MNVSDDIMQRIQKLLDRTVERGCTPAEAAGCAAKAQELMQRHGLSMFDVEAKTYGEKVEQEHRDLDFQRLPAWVHDMAGAVARPNGCDYVVCSVRQNGRKFHKIKFIGHTTDVKVVAYLYDVLSVALWKQSARDCRRLLRTGAGLAKARWDYMRGAAWAIEERLKEEARVTERLGLAVPYSVGVTEGLAAVPGEVFGAMVLVKDQAVKDYMAKEFPNIKILNGKDKSPRDHAAIAAGIKAGKDIPIKRGLDSVPQGRLT